MHADSWAIKAKKLGFRSRAVFKLEEILKKTKALKDNSLVLDIGCAPGGWSELIREMNSSSKIYAIDILSIKPIEGVLFFQEDVFNIDNIEEIYSLKSKFNLVISDLAPNLSGIKTVDEEKIFDLNILTLKIAKNYLNKSDGAIILKSFQNSLLKKFRTEMEKCFHLVQTYKPAASKSQSGEIYLFGDRPL